jgi:hypothetical protein
VINSGELGRILLEISMKYAILPAMNWGVLPDLAEGVAQWKAARRYQTLSLDQNLFTPSLNIRFDL